MPAPPQFLLARALALFSPRPAFALGQKETTAGPLRACCGLFSAVCIPVFVLGGLQRGHLPLGFSVPALGGTLQGNVARALQRLRNDTVELYRKIIALRAYAHNETETARVDGLLEEFPWAGAEAQPVKSPLRSAKVTQMTEKRCFMIFVLSILCSLGWEVRKAVSYLMQTYFA